MVRKPSQRVDAGSSGENKERKGLWSLEEDERLFNQITRHGVSTWSSVAQLAGLSRSGKSCRLRWMNYLRPDLKKEPISKREEEIIISLQQSLGNRWSMIAARMPGRTDNEIKNYWNTRIRKRLNTAAKAAHTGNSEEEPSEPAAGEKEESTDYAGTAAAPLPVPMRYPLFACQLLEVGSSLSPTTTTQKQNGSSEQAISDASAGEEAHGTGGHSEMVHDFLAFDELDYSLTVMDVPGVMDAWESELYSANSICSLD